MLFVDVILQHKMRLTCCLKCLRTHQQFVCVFLCIAGAKVGGCLLVFFLLFVFTNKERAEITVRKPDRFETNGG